MEAVSSLGAASAATTTSTKAKESDATQSNFLNLLVAQLRNQDPLDPVKNEDFIAQLAQLEGLEETKKMSSNLADMVNGQQFASASTLIGKEVLGAVITNDESRDVKGVVKSVSQSNGKVLIRVENSEGGLEQIEMSNVVEIRSYVEGVGAN